MDASQVLYDVGIEDGQKLYGDKYLDVWTIDEFHQVRNHVLKRLLSQRVIIRVQVIYWLANEYRWVLLLDYVRNAAIASDCLRFE